MYLVSETLSDLKNINAVMVITWFVIHMSAQIYFHFQQKH
jgi:hypothetical protein